MKMKVQRVEVLGLKHFKHRGEVLLPQVSISTTILVYVLDVPVGYISICLSYWITFHRSSKIMFAHGLISYKAHDLSRPHDLQYLHFETK